MLYIIIPAYNEEANIETVAREWHEVVEAIGDTSRLVIIDDGSKDSTYTQLLKLKKELNQLVPMTKPNGGHGATLLYGYHYAIEQGADYIFQTDSDGQTLPEEFWDFWNNRDNYDILIGNRCKRKDGISRIVVTKTLKMVIKLIFGVNVTDANTPFRLMKKEILQKYITHVPEDFNLTNVLLSVMFVYNHENVMFIPISFRQRQGGVNSINIRKITKIGLQAVKDFVAINEVMKANSPSNVRKNEDVKNEQSN